jgi:hypothetical protein
MWCTRFRQGNFLIPLFNAVFKGAMLMKAVTTAAVATATVASHLSYATVAAFPSKPKYVFESTLRYATPEELHHPPADIPPIFYSTAPQAYKKVDEMISRPKTTVEFVRNLKVIFDQDLLLQDQFYSEENLKNVFSLDEVFIDKSNDNGEEKISIIASVSDSVFPRIKTSGSFGGSIANAGFAGGRTMQRSGSTTAVINFGMYEGGPDFDTALRIFAKKLEYLRPQPSPHGGPPPATASHGNERWRYRQADARTDKTITLVFNQAGALSRVVIEIENNQKQEN